MGPPRQATGPPRQGAGVGVGMLRGYDNVSLEISKIQIKKLSEKAMN